MTADRAAAIANLIVGRSSRPRSCYDCGANTNGTDWYMVTDTVWRDAGMGAHDFLCITCLPKRLGRELTPDDLAHHPINLPGLFPDRPELHELKQRKEG